MRLRKAFLWSMIVSLCLAALLGIAALLLPNWARYDEEILFSTLLFGLYSLLALCCAIVQETRILVGWMWIGIGAAAAVLPIWLVMVWFADHGSGRRTALHLRLSAVSIGKRSVPRMWS